MATQHTLRILSASLLAIATFGCGEDGQPVGAGRCAEQPLYTFKYTPGPNGGTGTWTHVGLDGKPLSASQEQAIEQAQAPQSGGRCMTPSGKAITLGTGSGGSGATGDAGP
jgi:hypothetical protein